MISTSGMINGGYNVQPASANFKSRCGLPKLMVSGMRATYSAKAAASMLYGPSAVRRSLTPLGRLREERSSPTHITLRSCPFDPISLIGDHYMCEVSIVNTSMCLYYSAIDSERMPTESEQE